MAIPVSYTNYNGSWENAENWQGVFVFNIDKTGLDLKGKINHYDNESEYWYSGIKRSLFMDDVFYTISGFKVKANNLNDLSEINKVVFDNPNQIYYAKGVEVSEAPAVETDVIG